MKIWKLLYSLAIVLAFIPFNNVQAVVYMAPVDVTPGTTGSWQDVDLTAYVDAGATAGVYLEFINTGGTHRQALARKNGSTDQATPGTIDDQEPVSHTFRAMGVDTNDIVEIYLETTGFEVYLWGYFKEDESTFLTNRVDKSTTWTGAAWNDVDISGDISSETASLAFLTVNIGPSFVTDDSSLRPNGWSSSPGVTGEIYENTGQIVGLDSNNIFEYWSDEADQEVYLNGWMQEDNVDNFILNTAGVFTSFSENSTFGSYVTEDLSGNLPANAVGAAFTIYQANERMANARKVGETQDNYYDYSEWQTHTMQVSATTSVEQKIEDTNPSFLLFGWFLNESPAVGGGGASTTAALIGHTF